MVQCVFGAAEKKANKDLFVFMYLEQTVVKVTMTDNPPVGVREHSVHW